MVLTVLIKIDEFASAGCNPPMRTITRFQIQARSMALLLSAMTLALSGCGTAPGAAPGPSFPATHAEEVTDTYFGTPVRDPYRWLEDKEAPATQRWMRDASAHAAATLERIPGRAAMRARIAELDSGAAVQIGRVLRLPGELYVYERRGAAENQYAIVMRRGLGGAERVLVEPVALSQAQGGAPVAVNYFSASPDGKVLAYGVSARGSEDATLHLIDTESLRPIGTPITGANGGVARWAPESKSFTMNRLREGVADPKLKFQGSAAWLVTLEGGWARARQLLGPETRSVRVRASEAPTVLFTADGRWLIGLLEDGVRREPRVVVAPAASLAAGEPAWTVRIEPGDKIVDFAYGAGVLYATTHEGASRFRVIAAPIESFNAATARTVVPESERVLGLMVAARDALYFEAREGNVKQLWRLPYGADARAQRVPLPLAGTFSLRRPGGVWAAHAQLDGVLFSLEGWTHAPRLVAVAVDGRVEDTGLQPAGRFDAPADIETREVMVTSHDGVRVPMSIVHRRGLKLDGRNPTLLLGYGAYGFTWEPRFDYSRLAWIERGGVLAMVNPRGSGVFGRAWYEAGKQSTKPNTWRDMIASAEYLIATGYARPDTLAIEGRSAGGITSGRAATERPDLFAAVVPVVGVLDMVRAELEANGPPNIPEFGTHRDEAGFRSLLAMSTYHHIAAGVRYPAVMLVHGVNDPRVAVWHSSKTAARFAAASASVAQGRPVLLRLDYEAGHGVGNTRQQRQDETADIFSFLLWRLGHPDFQP
jgi:prolyl oligopeptidase